MIYRYGDEEIDYYALHFAGKTPNIARRDLRNETVVRVIISKYFHLYDTNRKVLLLKRTMNRCISSYSRVSLL